MQTFSPHFFFVCVLWHACVTQAFGLTLTDPKDVEGLPLSSKALAAQAHNAHVAAEAAAKTAKHDATTNGASAPVEAESADTVATAEAGPWRLCLDMPSYLPAMKHLKSNTVREQLYRAFVTRAGDANAPLLDQILRLKQQQAQFLGFATAAEVSMQAKMATTVEAVDALTAQLLAKAKPAAEQELKDLTAFAVAQGYVGGAALQLWDVPFWAERQAESLFEFEAEALRPYFALDNVLTGERVHVYNMAVCGVASSSSIPKEVPCSAEHQSRRSSMSCHSSVTSNTYQLFSRIDHRRADHSSDALIIDYSYFCIKPLLLVFVGVRIVLCRPLWAHFAAVWRHGDGGRRRRGGVA
jgi:hypothetical protein